APPAPPAPPAWPEAPATGQTIRMDRQPEAASAPAAEAKPSASALTEERLAILRMVEQGKITAQEASLLLEALG
ncbi:MAG TPA: hypothetical protein VGE07_21440, partial [Herpetosiphonaceae bacterium]